MAGIFRLRIDEIRLSQLYINSAKLAEVMNIFEHRNEASLAPIPIKEIDGYLVATDGHTRLLAWFLRGYEEVGCEWEDTEMDWEAYRICMNWCRDDGIESIADLQDRVIGSEQYQTLWLDRCRVMQNELAVAREKRSEESSNDCISRD